MVNRRFPWVLILGLWVGLGCETGGRSVGEELNMPAGVTVRETKFEVGGGEAGKSGVRAWVLESGGREAVVVPELGGRVMGFGMAGRSVVWRHPNLGELIARARVAKSPSERGGLEWLNFGGEKGWPWPQDKWPETWGAGWPPPAAFDRDTYQVTQIPGGVRMVSGSERGVRCVREVRMTEAGALRVKTRFEAMGERVDEKQDTEVAAWTVMQLPFGEMDAEVDLKDVSTWEVMKGFGEAGKPWTGAKESSGTGAGGTRTVTLPLRGGASQKVGADGGALVYRRGGLTIEGRILSVGIGRSFGNERLQVYRGEVGEKALAMDYVELEMTGLRRKLRSEGPAELEVEWSVHE